MVATVENMAEFLVEWKVCTKINRKLRLMQTGLGDIKVAIAIDCDRLLLAQKLYNRLEQGVCSSQRIKET